MYAGGLRINGNDPNTLYNDNRVLGITALNNIIFNTGTSLANYAPRMTINTSGNININNNVDIGGSVTSSRSYTVGEDYSYIDNWNSTGSSGWFVPVNQYWYTGHAYITVAIHAKNVAGGDGYSGVNGYCWFGHVFLSTFNGTPTAVNGGILLIQYDYRYPDSESMTNFISVKSKWDGNGSNVLWIEINNPVFAGTMRVKIYG